MSEVKRFGFGLDGPGFRQCSDGCYVLISDFDRVTAERDAALGREADLVERLTELRAELKTQTLRADAAVGDANEAEQRLTAADELIDSTKAELAWQESDNAELRNRVAVLEGLLHRVYDADLAARHHQPYNVSRLMDEIDAALKPAEGGGDKGCSACGSSAKDWNCNQCKPF